MDSDEAYSYTPTLLQAPTKMWVAGGCDYQRDARLLIAPTWHGCATHLPTNVAQNHIGEVSRFRVWQSLWDVCSWTVRVAVVEVVCLSAVRLVFRRQLCPTGRPSYRANSIKAPSCTEGHRPGAFLLLVEVLLLLSLSSDDLTFCWCGPFRKKMHGRLACEITTFGGVVPWQSGCSASSSTTWMN